jgi:hypothetical protein
MNKTGKTVVTAALNCKLDLYFLEGTLTRQRYSDQILRPLVVTHFDWHPLANQPIIMDDNAKPHRARIEHLWNFHRVGK